VETIWRGEDGRTYLESGTGFEQGVYTVKLGDFLRLNLFFFRTPPATNVSIFSHSMSPSRQLQVEFTSYFPANPLKYDYHSIAQHHICSTARSQTSEKIPGALMFVQPSPSAQFQDGNLNWAQWRLVVLLEYRRSWFG